MYERILVPLDGSPTAAMALEHAEALAEKLGSHLVLLRVVHTLEDLAPASTPSLAQAAMSQDVVSRTTSAGEHAAARAYLAELTDALSRRGVAAEALVREGAPAGQIVTTASTAAAGLIVMTAYGAGGAHTRTQRAVFGGTADEVLRQSRIPVLLIRP